MTTTMAASATRKSHCNAFRILAGSQVRENYPRTKEPHTYVRTLSLTSLKADSSSLLASACRSGHSLPSSDCSCMIVLNRSEKLTSISFRYPSQQLRFVVHTWGVAVLIDFKDPEFNLQEYFSFAYQTGMVRLFELFYINSGWTKYLVVVIGDPPREVLSKKTSLEGHFRRGQIA